MAVPVYQVRPLTCRFPPIRGSGVKAIPKLRAGLALTPKGAAQMKTTPRNAGSSEGWQEGPRKLLRMEHFVEKPIHFGAWRVAPVHRRTND